MAESAYLLCAAMSIACAVALLRGFRESRSRLLFWSSICFVGLAVNHVLLFVDLVTLPTIDLSLLRAGIALASVSLLLFGLVWESAR